MMKCPNCGAEEKDGMIFCGHCGSRLKNMEPSPSPKEEEKNDPEAVEWISKLEKEIQYKDQTLSRVRKEKTRWLVASLLLLAALFGVSMLYISAQDDVGYYQRRYSNLRSDYNDLSQQLEESADQVEFMNKYIVLINNNEDDMLYHTYNCSVWEDGRTSFFAYNISLAESRGYEPCPECCE